MLDALLFFIRYEPNQGEEKGRPKKSEREERNGDQAGKKKRKKELWNRMGSCFSNATREKKRDRVVGWFPSAEEKKKGKAGCPSFLASGLSRGNEKKGGKIKRGGCNRR